MKELIFMGTVYLKPRAWERTGGSGVRRYTPPAQAAYYNELAVLLQQAKFSRDLITPEDDLVIIAYFSYTGKSWKDTDNMLKALLDAGEKVFWPNDKQFSDVRAVRRRDAEEDKIEVRIWRL